MRPIKVVLLTTDNRGPFREFDKPEPWFGPAPEAILAGLASLPELEIHVISCIRRPVKAPEKLSENLWFHSLHVPKIGWMRTGYLGCIRAVRRCLKKIRPDLVHGQGTEAEQSMCAVLSGFPNVVTLHGIMREQARLLQARPGSFYWLANRLESFALRRTAGVFCNSKYTEESVRNRARKTWRVPNPLREAFFQPPAGAPEKGKPILLNVGLVCPRKRQNELLEAARQLFEEGLEFKLHFLGQVSRDDRYGAQFLDAVAHNPSFVSFLGFKPLAEVIKIFDQASAMVHVPSEESFGLVTAEALARNLKVFGFRVGGTQDIANGVDGADLVDNGDWIGLKAAIRNWIRAGAPRPTLAAATMRERFHPKVVGQRHLEIYLEVLGRPA